MKIFKTLLLLVLFTASGFTTMDPCTSSNSSFQGGEHVTYKIYYNWGYMWLSAGEVDFTVRETDKHYIVEATGRTYPTYEWFFKVDDYFKSVIDKETLLPIEFERNVHEGGYRMYNKIDFDQKKQKAMSYKGRTKDEVVAEEHSFDSCIHDILSTVYFLRNIDFSNKKKNDQIPINMIMDNETYPIGVQFKGRSEEKIKGLGDYKCIKISPKLIAGTVFDEDAEMNVWVSDDGNKVPLLIESPVSVGSIKAVLKSYSGLKVMPNSQLK